MHSLGPQFSPELASPKSTFFLANCLLNAKFEGRPCQKSDRNPHDTQATVRNLTRQWDFGSRRSSKLLLVCAFPRPRLNSFYSSSVDDSLQDIPRRTWPHSAAGSAARSC